MPRRQHNLTRIASHVQQWLNWARILLYLSYRVKRRISKHKNLNSDSLLGRERNCLWAFGEKLQFRERVFLFSSSPLLNPQPYGTQFHTTQLRFVGSASVPRRGHNFKEILRNNLRACINIPTTNSSEWRIFRNLLTSLSFWAVSHANLFSLTPHPNLLPRRGWNLTKRYSSIHYVDWVLNKPFTFIVLCSPLIFCSNILFIESREAASEDGFGPT